ncbi:UPF0158 family protein [Alkalicoccus saliphilus]|uniref:Uncharacterized protein n=1 Tax=Alkalicoccus saliphilus TaxID=200989 RepID=A0A2T4U2I2_9BACI|nr:UPF0158 family protein [Alkalicoccus saliphilus]PTL37612.1 hypothetical protein C6Y45_15675 [Alkalicoccus saliphilus]
MVKVKLQDIIEEMSFQFDEWCSFLHLDTGEVIGMHEDLLMQAEENGPESEDGEEDLTTAWDIFINTEKYAALPDRFEINEYSMMEDFCLLQEGENKEKLLYAIRGGGAFRRFKDLVLALGIEQEWYDYRDSRYRQVAIRFCERHNMPYEE